MSIKEFKVCTNENEVEAIIVRYKDGIEKKIHKGMALTIQEEGDNANVSMEFLGCDASDIELMVEGFVNLGMRMSLFDGSEDSEG